MNPAPVEAPPALAAALAGVTLVEASAGTGKTWTLSGLFLRLVVEEGLAVDRILAVTYTRAATAELAGRIRRRLEAVLDALDGRSCDDMLCRAIAERAADPALARRRAAAALADLDAAAIHTIHAFCQRVLADHAFASGRPFSVELAPDDDAALDQAVQDFWRREVTALDAAGEAGAARLHRLFVAHLLAEGCVPDALVERIRTLAARHGLRVDTAEPAAARAGLDAWFEARAAFAADWRAGRDGLLAAIAAHRHFRRNTYQARHVDPWAGQVDAHLEDRAALTREPKNLYRFGSAALAADSPGHAPPVHPLIDRVDAYRAALVARDAALAALAGDFVARLLEAVRHERRRVNRERRVAGYDDLVGDLAEALAGPAAEGLAASLRQRYPAALIDEFQDTDVRQYGIFRRIYGSAPPQAVFLVGDPKQAIYSFRGADVFAYLAAAGAAAQRLRLAENRRSVARLVAAVNTLFDGADPFHLPGIDHPPVRAAGEHPPLTEAGVEARAVMRLRLLDAGGARPLSRDAARAAAAALAADEIRRLLGDASVRLGEARIEGRHIAVLVGTHNQAGRVRRALAERGIACALQGTDSVFAADEAEWLEQLLLALAEPQHPGLLAAARAGGLFEATAAELLALDSDEAEWERWQQIFLDYQGVWRQRGVAVMLRRLMSEQGVVERLAARADGERRITNLFHLAELAQDASRQRPGAEALIEWLAGERRAERRGDATQLRLESDENLVRVLTVHAAKGLEFPITFCPFLWDVPRRDAECLYHDAAADNAPVLDLGSPGAAAARAQADAEALAERLRVAYVALTRASHRCELVWGGAPGAESSALAWLLHRSDGASLPDEAGLRARIEALAAASEGAIALLAPAATTPAQPAASPAAAELAARRMARPLPPPWRVSSFSSLLREAGEAARSDLPDHDQRVAGVGPAGPPGGGRFDFPRGAGAGVCLHAILERIDFGAAPPCWRGDIDRELAAAGYPAAWAGPLAAWLAEALGCAWPDGGTLAQLPRARTLREMEFHLPARGDAAGLAALFARHGLPVPALPPARLAGFLTGYVDLVFERDGRYHLADYKSNWLGAAPAAYRREGLEAAMRRDAYHLQGTLYALALHRHLRLRVAGYRYASHFGAIHYLFLRGMGAGEAGAGIYDFRPDEALIAALDAFFGAPGLAREEP